MSTDVEESTEVDTTALVEFDGVEMTLEEATAVYKARLEEQLCDRTQAVTEATEAFKKANDEAKAKKEELSVRESLLWQTNRDLRIVLKGEWVPPKPDPQKELPFGEEDESAAVWKSTPVDQLNLSKNILRILENEGFTTVGMMVGEIDHGAGFLNINELTEGHIGKILKAVAEFRAKVDGVPGPAESVEE